MNYLLTEQEYNALRQDKVGFDEKVNEAVGVVLAEWLQSKEKDLFELISESSAVFRSRSVYQDRLKKIFELPKFDGENWKFNPTVKKGEWGSL